jgi:t-SNARE complex subunit (syntaxin)
MSQTAEAQQLLRDIQSRHEDIVKLEESLRELRQLFLDMQALVESQGETLDQIEAAVDSAVDFTAKGLDEMKKAVKYQKSARKVHERERERMCVCVCVCVGATYTRL